MPLSQTANSKDEEFAENKITDKACIQCILILATCIF